MKKSLRILITAGPTIEPIDPVRFISNRSSGYMGYELAHLAKKRKHKVMLITGPTAIKPPGGIRLLRIETARDLQGKIRRELKKFDVLIMPSAVSDFRPASFSKSKIKTKKHFMLKLIRNPDILGSIKARERKGKILVGFSLETESLLRNAEKKLEAKNLDLIVTNRLSRDNIPFGRGLKSVYLLGRHRYKRRLRKATKRRIARAILDRVEELCYTPN